MAMREQVAPLTFLHHAGREGGRCWTTRETGQNQSCHMLIHYPGLKLFPWTSRAQSVQRGGYVILSGPAVWRRSHFKYNIVILYGNHHTFELLSELIHSNTNCWCVSYSMNHTLSI